MTDYYTKRAVKGTGTGGQVSATQKSVQEVLAWIRAFSEGAVLPPRKDYPRSHHVSDEARRIALEDGLLSKEGGRYIRTGKLAGRRS